MTTDVPITGTITPMRQQPVLGAIAAALRKAQQFAGQYEIDKRIPLLGGTSVDELLSLPGAASLVEDVSYFGPSAIIRGGNAATGGIGTFRLDPRVADVADVTMNVTPLAVLSGKGAVKGVKALEDAIVGARQRDRIRSAASKVPEDTAYEPLRQRMEERGNLAYAVKPKGGNWLAGHTDYALAPLRRNNAPILSGDIVNRAAGRDLFSEYRKVYEQDPTIGLHDWMRTTHPDIYAKIQNPEERAVSRWIDTKLDKYIRNEMGTPEDPVRALAERGVLHVSPDELNYRLEAHGLYPRLGQQALAGSDAAKMWEGASDNAINVAQAGDYLKFMNDTEYAKTIEKNPWLKKVPPETKVYGTAEAETLVDDLGFNHLIDELKNAMDPNSGLPRNLRIDPESIDKITMAQAVERVSKINAWRAEQKVAADAARAGNSATQPIKEYPDAGLRWVELKLPEPSMEGLKSEYLPEVDMWRVVDENGGVVSSGATEREALGLLGRQEREGALADALKYEGEMLGHCVGGYCNKVLSGKSRIISLRDTKGAPRVTIELTPAPQHKHPLYKEYMQDFVRTGPGGEYAERYLEQRPWGDTTHTVVLSDKIQADFPKWLKVNYPERFEELGNMPASVEQIKAKSNRLAGEKDLPFVLDFLNSRNLGEVKDLPSGAVDLKDPSGVLRALKSVSPKRNIDPAIEAFNRAVEAQPDAPRFMTIEQLRDFLYPPAAPTGYSKGGVVKSLAEAVEKYLGREAAQTAAAAAAKEAPKEQRMLQGFYRGYAGDYDADKAAADAGMVFVAPQRAAAEFYAKKRARQMGEDPHLEMILADPFAGYIYGHNIPLGPDNRKVDFTKARQLQPEHVKSRTKLYAAGGAVNFDPDEIAQMAGEFTDQFTPGYAAGGLVKYDPAEIDTIVSKMKEAFHG